MKRFSLIAAASLAASALLGLAPHASAALISSGLSCTNKDALSGMNPDAIACSGAWNGNDANQQADVKAQLATDFNGIVGVPSATWSLVGKSDDSNNGPFTSNPNGSTGTLTFDTAQTGFFAIALKSSTNFSFYLFNGGTTGISSIDYTNVGTSLNGQGIAQGLSHATLYRYSENTPPTSKVPEPASTAALGVALVGMYGLRKRVKKA